MTAAEIDAVVRQTCPLHKKTCALALMGGCTVVRHWLREHRANWHPSATADSSEAAESKRAWPLVSA